MVRFPMEKRRAQIARERVQDEVAAMEVRLSLDEPNCKVEFSNPNLEKVGRGVYVWKPGWFGVRLRPDDPQAV